MRSASIDRRGQGVFGSTGSAAAAGLGQKGAGTSTSDRRSLAAAPRYESFRVFAEEPGDDAHGYAPRRRTQHACDLFDDQKR